MTDEFAAFDSGWSPPERIAHLDFEVVKLDPDVVSSGPIMVPGPNGPMKKPDAPVIVVEGERSLDEQEGQLILGLHDLHETAKIGIIQRKMGCNPVQADYLLNKLLQRIQEETGWSENKTLINLLIREIFEPSINDGYVKFPSDLEDTFRLYVVEDGATVRWTSIPYHAASLKLGDVVYKDFDQDMGDDMGSDGYPESEWGDLGPAG